MTLLLAAAALVLAQTPAAPAQPPKPEMKAIQLVFFVDGPKSDAGTKAQLAKTQADHLAFLERLWKERKALLVGPLLDSRPYRGIVALDVPDGEAARKLLLEDPYIRSGALDLVVYQWFTAVNYILQGPKFLDLDTLWFGVLRRADAPPKIGDEEAKAIQEGHMANINAMHQAGYLLLAGPVSSKADEKMRGIFIFKGAEKKRVEELAAKDPAIARGRLKLDLYRWMTAKGSFLPPPKSG